MRPSLNDLGPRICIMGPSNSGKSTLAKAIGNARGQILVHLDQLRHIPQTDWKLRPIEEFFALHDKAIEGTKWVIEGNYSCCLSQRLEKATGFILLDISTGLSLARYMGRSVYETDRAGSLEGIKDHVKWSMIQHIIGPTRTNRRRYKEIFDNVALPKIRLSSAHAIKNFYASEKLHRHPDT